MGTCFASDAGEVDEPLPDENPGTLSTTFDMYLTAYQTVISPVHGKQCVFTPSCSAYARLAIKKYGFIKAYPLITARLLRCNAHAITSRNYTTDFNRDGGPCDDPLE
jgi:putative membrane protein insertion efficiency factor